MILIADSGSTKCHWAYFNQKNHNLDFFKTLGLNPYFFSKSDILKELQKSDLNIISNDVKEIFFYGAGCSTDILKKNIKHALSTFFINANIYIYHDLIGACRATFKGKNNINCIIGTGSIACLYDGKNATPSIPSLGFILGDEGSGNYFGKKLLNLYFTQNLPSKIKAHFEEKYNIHYEDLLTNVYQNNRANSFLSSFFPFLLEHKYFNKILNIGVEDFLKKHVFCIKDFHNYDINFIGSVAYYLKDIILEKSKQFNFSVGTFVQEPIMGLVKYHTSNK